MPSDPPPPPRGFRLSAREMEQLGIEPRVHLRFQSDKLELKPAMFEIVAVDSHGVVVERISWIVDAERN